MKNIITLIEKAKNFIKEGSKEKANEYFLKALDIDPNNPYAHSEYALFHLSNGDSDPAERHAKSSLNGNSKDLTALYVLGSAYLQLGLIDDSIKVFIELLNLDPHKVDSWRALLTTSLYDPKISPSNRHNLHRSFNNHFPANPHRLFSNAPLGAPTRRLKIGVLSSDFFFHPVSRNYLPILSRLDRNHFELYCYSLTKNADNVTETAKKTFDFWRDLNTKASDEEIANKIFEDKIDILISIATHFDNNKPLTLQLRPAPIIVSCGDGPLNIDSIDYLISDPIMAPRALTPPVSERVFRLPNFYVHNPITLPFQDQPPPQEYRLLSLQNPTKINDEVLRTWGKILRAEPQATLTFRYQDRFLEPRLQQRCREACGEDVAARLSFEGRNPKVGLYYKSFQSYRLTLDSFPFNGSTTTFESLWMGVPVITLLGDSIFSRWSASLLTQIGRTECIASSIPEYVDKTITLLRDDQKLSELRRTLRPAMAQSNICNPQKVSRWFSRFFLAIWRKWEKENL